jgi:hypothetical protein
LSTTELELEIDELIFSGLSLTKNEIKYLNYQ